MEDENQNASRNTNRNPWWGDFSQLQFQIKPKSGFEFIPRDIKFDQNLNSNLYSEILGDLSFSILTS